MYQEPCCRSSMPFRRSCSTRLLHRATASRQLHARFRKITLVWADGGYAVRLVTLARRAVQLTVQIVPRTDAMTGFVVLPRRWCVERPLGWLLRSRHLMGDSRRCPPPTRRSSTRCRGGFPAAGAPLRRRDTKSGDPYVTGYTPTTRSEGSAARSGDI